MKKINHKLKKKMSLTHQVRKARYQKVGNQKNKCMLAVTLLLF